MNAQYGSFVTGARPNAEDGLFQTLFWLAVVGALCMAGIVAIWKLRKYLEDEDLL